MSSLIDVLGVDGTLLVVGASADPITVTPIQLIGKRRSIEQAGTAYDRMISGKARFRAVLMMT